MSKKSLPIPMIPDIGKVPCNGCTVCCQNYDLVRLFPFEDPYKWKTEPHPFKEGSLMLAHKPNGDCYYLSHTGCTIQDDKPQMCQKMDCRLIASRLNYTQARKHSGVNMVVWRKGKELLRLLK